MSEYPQDLSPDPGVPQTADKAKAAAAVSGALVALLLALALYYDGRNGTNFAEMLMAILGGLGVAGGTGFATFKTKNKRTGV